MARSSRVSRSTRRDSRTCGQQACPRPSAPYFSLDSKQILTISNDRTSRIWRAADGAAVAVLRGHQARINTARFSPDGTEVLTASDDKTARVWSAKSGNLLSILEVGDDGIRYARFSPDGRLILASNKDRSRLLDGRTGEVLAVVRGHRASPVTIEFSASKAIVGLGRGLAFVGSLICWTISSLNRSAGPAIGRNVSPTCSAAALAARSASTAGENRAACAPKD
jgi:WD40 repeat protein